jgi:HAD superfamily hydrolase (TIGR01549 family)
MKAFLTIFDLDGTLLNSSHTLYEAYQNFLSDKYNIKIDFYDLYPIIHKPYEDVLRKFTMISETDLQEFESKLKLKKNYHVNLFPHTESILKYLKDISYTSTATNMSESFASEILERFELTKYFDLIIGLNKRLKPKPNPDMIFEAIDAFQTKSQNVYFVGDSSSDMQAGRYANVNTVLINHHQYHKENNSLVDYHINELNELKQIIKRK